MSVSTVLIGNEGADHLLMTLGTGKHYDGWIDAEIAIRCDVWSARLNVAFRVGELSYFAEQVRKLHKDLVGAATLDPAEPNVVVTLTGNGKGQILVEGTAQNHFERRNFLTFQFEIDQSYLPRIAAALLKADPER